MKRMPGGGYTIIEVTIFLIISSSLMTSVMLMVSGRQERVRFTQTVNTFDQDLRDILNDVSTGYYPSSGNSNFICQTTPVAGGNVISFSAGSVEQGANTGCIFLGKAIQLGASNVSEYKTYTMVASRNATSLSDADTKLLGLGSNPGIVDTDSLLADIEITKVVSQTNPGHNVKGIALVSEFSQTSTINNNVTGNATRISLYEVLDNFDGNAGKDTMPVATNGVLICLQQGAGGRKAAILLGSGGQQLSTEVKLDTEVPTGPSGCPE